MSEELRACPFCGKQEVEIVIEHGCETLPNYKKFYFTNCKNCGSLIDSYRIIDELVAHFNTRPIEDALNAEIARLTARVQELEDANFKLRDELNAIETVTDARFEYKNGELSTHEMVSDTFARLDQAHAELAELREANRWIPVGVRLPKKNAFYQVVLFNEQDNAKWMKEVFFSCQEKKWDSIISKVILWRENLPLPDVPAEGE